MKRYVPALLLALSLSAPVAAVAQEHNQRYYDKQHKDYHEWNANEEKNFNVYLGEKHIKVHTWTKAKPRERQDYWNWRHDHPDGRR
jgi:hypothetical protein